MKSLQADEDGEITAFLGETYSKKDLKAVKQIQRKTSQSRRKTSLDYSSHKPHCTSIPRRRSKSVEFVPIEKLCTLKSRHVF